MSDEAGGFQQAVPPAYYPAPAYYPPQPPPGYYPPPGYAPPGYPPPGYAPPGYPQAGYPRPGYAPPALKPGVIPLRPLTLSDIYNGAVAYIRMNAKATMGLTAVVVVAAQVIALILQVGPLAASGALSPAFGANGELPSTTALVGSSLSGIAGALTTWLSSILLTGLLTVIVGRAVFGASITIGEAWQRVRGRLLSLFAVTALEAVGVVIVLAIGVGVVFAVSQIANGGVAFFVGVPLAVVLGALLVYLWTMLSFAPPLIVLERLGVMAAITRSFALIRNDFWRVLGIRLLALLVAGMIAGAVTFPFSTAGQITLMNAESDTAMIVALVLISVGGAIGEIITAPFTAGVVVLQYADRRMRAEAFDLVLLGGAAAEPDAPADSTDPLWLTPHP